MADKKTPFERWVTMILKDIYGKLIEFDAKLSSTVDYPTLNNLLKDIDKRLNVIEAEMVKLSTPVSYSSLAISDLLARRFDDVELDGLIDQMGHEPLDIKGRNHTERARLYEEYCGRRGLTRKLIETCRQLRPELSWPQLPDVY